MTDLTAVRTSRADNATEPPPPGALYVDPESPASGLKFDLLGDVLPTGHSARIGLFLGSAEKALRSYIRAITAGDRIAMVDRMVDFLACVVEEIDGQKPLRNDLLSLDDADVTAVQLRTRYLSYEETTVSYTWACLPPYVHKKVACEFEGNGTTSDIADLRFRPMPATAPLRLEKSGVVATWAPNTLKAQLAYARRRGRVVDGEIDPLALFRSRLVEFDGKQPSDATLLNLHPKDREALRAKLLEWGGVDPRVSGKCQGCGARMEMPLPAIEGFWFPGSAAAD